MFSVLSGSTRIISDKPFSPKNCVQLVEKHKINYAFLAPIQLAVIAAYKEANPIGLSSIRNLIYGGGILSQATLKRSQELLKGANFTGAYGMTECGMITINTGVTNLASAGRPFPGTRLRIVDESGRNLRHNKMGEIYICAYWQSLEWILREPNCHTTNAGHWGLVAYWRLGILWWR